MATTDLVFIERIAKEIVDIAFCLHKELGPGLLESIYEKGFCYELSKRNINFVAQKKIRIKYKEIVFEEGLRIDILVENTIIVELKAQENYHPVWEAKLLSYMKLTDKRMGFIINFNVPLIKNGIKRMIR
jgi:GxxExxY protein